jgi:Glycosyl transferase family 2/Uncharacterized conserved protein (DUF2304)
MGLRILGGAVAVLLAALLLKRYRRGQLRRNEAFIVLTVVAGLAVAAVRPTLFDPGLGALGFEPGNQRRLIVVLVLSQIFTLLLLFAALARNGVLSSELGSLVDYGALRRFETDGRELSPGGCLVVIPAHNEAQNLLGVLTAVPREVCGLPAQLVVVADGCTDGTEEVAREGGALVIQRDLRRGQGAAIRLGYVAALRADSHVVVTMDADGQHDPGEIEGLVRPLLEGKADMVQGSRVLGSSYVEQKIRRYGVQFFARILTFLSGTRITDPANGFRAVLTSTLRSLDLRQDQFFVSEIILDAAQKGLRVHEIPITVRGRIHGKSKKGTTLRYALGFARGLAGTWMRQAPGKRPIASEPRWLTRSGAPPADHLATVPDPDERRARRTGND